MSNLTKRLPLEPHHIEDLQRSGLSLKTIREANLRSISAEAVERILGFNITKSAGLAFPYLLPEGTASNPFIRVKIDLPPMINGKTARYLSPKGSGNRLYIPPGIQSSLKDTFKTIYITEGEKKALKAVQEGLCCVALSGVWCWREKDHSGKSHPIGDLDLLEWNDRHVFIVFDSDVAQKPSVLKAEKALAEELVSRGAIVRLIRLPNRNKDKTGLDDFLMENSINGLLELLQIYPLDQKKKNTSRSGETQNKKLIDYGSLLFLFHDQHKEAFAFIDGNSVPLGAKRVKRWLTRCFYKDEGKAPNTDTLNQAILALEAKALFDGPEITLNNRVASHEGAFWYDLGNGQAIKTVPGKWEIAESPVLFRRYSHQQIQVTPSPGGDPFSLFRFLNVRGNQELLVLACIISYFIPDIPHPIFHPHGPHGSGKTSFCVLIKRLCDPSTIEALISPKNPTQLIQLLAHHHICLFDNMSNLPDWMSDILCQACTGGGFSKRQLYTDDDDIIYQIKRCVGLNGINLLTVKSDILDRSILLHLERIDSRTRLEESDMWRSFNEAKPKILSGIFDALSRAMAIYPTVDLPYLPRMADFARWGAAIAEALGSSGDEFLQAYQSNVNRQNEEVVQSNTLAQAVLTLMSEREFWESTVKKAHDRLREIADPDKKDPTFPKSSRTLRKHLERIKANLQDYSITYTIGERTRDGYPIIIRKDDNFGSFDSLASQPLKDKELTREPYVNESEVNGKTPLFDSPPNPLKDNIRELGEPNAANLQAFGDQSTNLHHKFDDRPPELRDELEERAAIMEFDGGLSRDEAEIAALLLAGEPT